MSFINKFNLVNKFTPNKNREGKPTTTTPAPLQKSLHFWLGANTSAERSGAVAYKVIELDNHLGNSATQYREAQQHESTRFASYFKDTGIMCAHFRIQIKSFTIFISLFQYFVGSI